MLERTAILDMSERMLAEVARDALSEIAKATPSRSSQCPKTSKRPPEDFLDRLRGIDRWIETDELADLLACRKDRIYDLIAEKDLPADWFEGRRRYYPPKVAQWLESRARVPNRSCTRKEKQQEREKNEVERKKLRTSRSKRPDPG